MGEKTEECVDVIKWGEVIVEAEAGGLLLNGIEDGVQMLEDIAVDGKE